MRVIDGDCARMRSDVAQGGGSLGEFLKDFVEKRSHFHRLSALIGE